MKVAARCLIAVVMLAAASFAFAHPFKSKIITTSPLMITVGDDQLLNIKNFSQEGGIDRGVVSVTFTGENGGTANVLTAIRIDLSTGSNSQNFPEIGNKVIIAGPAQVTVAPVIGATLSITFRKESNGGSGGGGIFGATPTASPVITFTATPTASPIIIFTATPTASPIILFTVTPTPTAIATATATASQPPPTATPTVRQQ
jgi:hypothetical protein